MIYERLRELCRLQGIRITNLEKELGFAKGSLCKIDRYKPSQERVDKLAKRLGVTAEYIMTGKTSEGEPYYIENEAKELSQFLFQHPEYMVLFDASRRVKKDDIEFVKKIIDLVGKEGGQDK